MMTLRVLLALLLLASPVAAQPAHWWWEYDTTTLAIVDYVASTEAPRGGPKAGTARVVGGPLKPVGDPVAGYRFDGAAIVLRSLAERKPRAAEKAALRAAVDAASTLADLRPLLKRLVDLAGED